MKSRIFTLALLLLFGVFQVAFAFSPGGEEKGGKSREAKDVVVKATPSGESVQAQRLADDAISTLSGSAVAAEATAEIHATSTSKEQPQLAVVLDRREAAHEATLSKKEARKTLKEAIRNSRKVGKNQSHPESPMDDDTLMISMILAIILPPLGVAVWENDITSHFWIALLLTLLFYLPGLIYALYIILS